MNQDEGIWQPKANTHAPEGSAQRTGEHTLDALVAFLKQQKLPAPTRLLEIASGFGHHLQRIAAHWPALTVQPTEAQQECLDALEHVASETASFFPPRRLNVLDEAHWQALEADTTRYDGFYCSNLIHISPWATTDALFRHAATLLQPQGWVFLYGAYLQDGRFTSEGDARFDASLKSRDPAFGLRDPADVDAVAARYGFKRVFSTDMPSNNKAFAWMR